MTPPDGNRPADDGAAPWTSTTLEPTLAPDTDTVDPAWLDIQSERAVVGTLLLAGDVVTGEILAMLNDADFLDPKCRLLITVVRALHEAGAPHDAAATAIHVASRGFLSPGAPRMNLATYLIELVSTAPPPVTGQWWARRVLEAAARRRIAAAGARLISVADAGDVEELTEIVAAEMIGTLAALERAVQR
jgi:replicative DNA helicase